MEGYGPIEDLGESNVEIKDIKPKYQVNYIKLLKMKRMIYWPKSHQSII